MFSLCSIRFPNAQAITQSSKPVIHSALLFSLYTSPSPRQGILCSLQLALHRQLREELSSQPHPAQAPQDAHSLRSCNQARSIETHLLISSLCCPRFCGSPLKTWASLHQPPQQLLVSVSSSSSHVITKTVLTNCYEAIVHTEYQPLPSEYFIINYSSSHNCLGCI